MAAKVQKICEMCKFCLEFKVYSVDKLSTNGLIIN